MALSVENTPIKLLAVFLIMIVLAAYGSSLRNGFVQDDALFITQNSYVKSWENFPSIFTKAYMNSGNNFSPERLTGSGEITYRPIATISYFLDYAINGMNPFGYHLANVLLHALTVLILFGFALRILKAKSAAFVAAMIFAVHPINNEAVNVIAFRKDLFACLFTLSSFLFYLKKLEASKSAQSLYSVISAIFFFFAVFSKEIAITFPLLLILYDGLLGLHDGHRISLGGVIRRYGGYFLVLTIYFSVFFALQPNFNNIHPGFRGGSFFSNLMMVLNVVTTYLCWIFYPLNIHVALTEPLTIPSTLCLQTVTSLTLILFSLSAAFWLRKKDKILSFAIFWFFITLIPAANLLPLSALIASRFLYLPMVGAALFLAQAGVQVSTFRSRFISALFIKKLLRIFAAVFIGLCFLITISRNSIWKSDRSLWAESVRIYPKDFLAHTNLADVMSPFPELFGQAVLEYKIAIQLAPLSPFPYNRLAIAYRENGNYDLAIEFSENALRVSPGYLNAYQNLALIYMLKKEWKTAAAMCRQMIALNPHLPDPYDCLGLISGNQGHYDEAIGYFTKAFDLDPYDPIALLNKGVMYFKKGQKEKAAESWHQALRLRPGDLKARSFLAELSNNGSSKTH